MNSVIERNRHRLVNTYLSELVRKTGNMITTVELKKGLITSIQLDADIMHKALIKLFENIVSANRPADQVENEIATTYSDCVDLKSGKITDIGEGFISALLSNLTEQAYSARGK